MGWTETGLGRRLLAWWYGNRPWPIRDKVFTLPSHLVASEAATRLVIYAEPDAIADAAWTARSFLGRLDRAPAGRLALDLYVDVDDRAKLTDLSDRWMRLFPGSEVRASWDAVDKLAPVAPALAALAKSSAEVRRLAVILHSQEQDNVLFALADVLLLGLGRDLNAAVAKGTTAVHLQESGVADRDAALREYARKRNKPLLAEHLDLGLLFLPRASLEIAEAEALLADQAFLATAKPIDRAVLALLLGMQGARPLPPRHYLVSDEGRLHGRPDIDYARLALRRFSGPVRHLLYARGMPLLWDQWIVSNARVRPE
jgi:hypothetical protein